MSTKAGKTAPRLIQDLLTYDPRYEQRAERNLLTTSPPLFDPAAAPKRAVPARNCRHELRIKHEQSVTPEGQTFSAGEVYKIATYCQKCRWHVDLFVDLRDDAYKTTPCEQTSHEYTLHHFMFVADETGESHPMGNANIPRSFRFRCSAPRCPAEVHIRMRPPRITDEYITTLSDKTLLRKRLETAKQLGGDRADAQMARPVDGIDFLCTYLTDSLNPVKGKSRIPLLNRKFLKTFGKDCDRILNDLGFKHEVEQQEDGSDTEIWNLPRPPPPGNPLDLENQRTVVEDAQHELVAILLERFSSAERAGARNPMALPQPAISSIERVLGCIEYQKRPSIGTRSSNHEEDHPYYAGLGAVGDFSDALLLFAYTCQARVDLENGAYYFEALQDIATGRKSEMLEMQVQMLASQGVTNRKEITDAYRYLGVDPGHLHLISDDHILGAFRSRLQDISPAAVEETRNALRIIGRSRNSERIKQEASNAIETYDQALSWLGIDEGQPDDFVVTMFTIKTGDNPSNIDIARRAIEIIAEKRQSQILRDWLVSGVLQGTGEMDLGEAYALLGINNRTSSLDLDTLQAQVTFNSSENPSNKEKYEKAYALICKDQQTNHKGSQNGFSSPMKNYPLESWPVGCINIGNTCYLNSVLQFLFTVKPLRDMVLDCDTHMQEITPEALETKRVGRSEVTATKVEKAQQFVHELRSLFQRMITANTHCIRPELRLAALALAKTDEIATTQPASNGAKDPGLGEIEGIPVNGPMPKPDVGSDNKEDMADSVMGDDTVLKNDASSTIAEADAGDDGIKLVDSTNGEKFEAGSKPEAPSRPPPVPPRPLDLKKIEGLAQQQDAAEILQNAFDLLSCAFQGNGTLDDGEQNDIVKDLFFSDVTAVRKSKDKTTTNKALQDTTMVSPGNRNRPLYAALDDEFTLTELENTTPKTKKFEYIARASPILIINVRRLVYEGGKPIKDESHVGLDDVLYLDRYLAKTETLSREALQELRERQWQLQHQLRSLDARKKQLSETDLKANLPDTLEETAVFIEDVNKTANENLVDVEDDPVPTYPELVEQLQEQAHHLQKEIEILEGKMKELDEQSNAIFQDCKDHPYRLHAVFMHRGSSVGGHYWIYIYDFQNNIWRDYNDEHVQEVEVQKIFEQNGNATSTGVVYVREDKVKELTEAVHRIPQPLAAPVEDVEMKDAPTEQFPDVHVIDGIEKE